MMGLLALVLAADPCAPVARAAEDPALAAVYATVAREEAARGAKAASAAAWRRAAELEPPGGPSELELRRLCAGWGSEAGARAPLLGLRPAAESVRRAAGRDRLVFEVAAEAGYDSNATLASAGGAHDGFGAATAVVALRPLGASGPFAVAGGGYRKQVLFGQSDVGLATGNLGWEQALGPVRASLDYGLDYLALGGAPWMLRHRGTAFALARLGAVSVLAEYSLRYELLWPDAAQADTGLRHAGQLAAGVDLGPWVLELAAVVLRASGATPERSSIEGGGELRLGVASPSGRVTLDVTVGVRWRGFDAVDPDLLVLRREAQLDGRAEADLALDPGFALFVALEARGLLSSVPGLSYARVGASAGLRFKVGLW